MKNVHVWQKVEIVLHATKKYKNPYNDVDVWVNLQGPDFQKRCFGFWDGDDVFRVRIMAAQPGLWRWRSECSTDDPTLSGQSGEFTALAWSEEEKQKNPNRRGMIQPTPNGHAFQYADGTPYFLLGDTSWAVPTYRFPWHDDDNPRDLGPRAGFKDYVQYRKNQGYNCIAMIASFPNWQNDDKPNRWMLDNGMVVRWGWQQAGTESIEAMHNENGETAFNYPGKLAGLENYVPNLEMLNPVYFQMLDKKIDYLNAHGFIPFIEVARRDIGQVWMQHYPWPESYSRYIHYVWTRYQANICFFSPIHYDSPEYSIPASEWNKAALYVMDKYGLPPFGTLLGTNANPSSLLNWGHVDKARWLSFHQIGNRRTHDVYQYLTDIYNAKPAIPGINGEPYYDGMEDAEPGSVKAARYCRSAIYGSVLSGGLGGHIYGAGGWQGGIWSGEVEESSQNPIWEAIKWESAVQMPFCQEFILSEGNRYQDLVPSTEVLQPNRSGDPKSNDGWAYCAMTPDKNLVYCYFEKGCPQATLSDILLETQYLLQWFNPRTGGWIHQDQTLLPDINGKVLLPKFPGSTITSQEDWGLKLIKK